MLLATDQGALPRTRIPTPPELGQGSIEVTALSIGAAALNRLIGEPPAAALLRCLDIDRLPSARVRPLPFGMMAMMHACFAEHLTGGLRAVHAQARVLDFIIALFEYLVDTSGPETQRFNVARALHEELARTHALPPRLDDMASRFRLSKRAMNAAFRREYGQSLAAFVNDLRLDRAHAALSSGRTPLKVIAAELGFADVSHFSNAFTKRFGYRPGGLRRTAER